MAKVDKTLDLEVERLYDEVLALTLYLTGRARVTTLSEQSLRRLVTAVAYLLVQRLGPPWDHRVRFGLWPNRPGLQSLGLMHALERFRIRGWVRAYSGDGPATLWRLTAWGLNTAAGLLDRPVVEAAMADVEWVLSVALRTWDPLMVDELAVMGWIISHPGADHDPPATVLAAVRRCHEVRHLVDEAMAPDYFAAWRYLTRPLEVPTAS